jgi:hypothetical protein
MKTQNLIGAVVSAVAGLTVGAYAGIDGVLFVNDQSLANAAAYTNSFGINGRIVGVAVKIEDCASAVRTNAVSITSADGQTLFSANVVGTCTNYYQVKVKETTTAGVDINESTVAATTNNIYGAQAVAGKVTCTVTGVAFPTLTNSVTVRVLVDR